MNRDQSNPKHKAPSGLFWLLLLLLGGTFAVLCHEGFLPYEVFWANDSALGAMKNSSARLPGMFTGYWSDFWWLGGAVPSTSPSLSSLFASILSPEHYLKVYAPLTMVFLGCCVWFFFRQLRFAPMVCVIAGLGAGLNMHFFSNACWGLGTWVVSAAMVFVALGIIVSPDIRQLWIKGVLAGLAVGMVVMEGFDVGAIFSIYVGIFVVFYFLTAESNPGKGALKALEAGMLVVVFAFFISASTLYTLVGTQLTGSSMAGENERDSEARWDFNTQWSIPKLESLRVFIPGLFGYRMQEFTTSTNKSGSYWGSVAEDPRVERLESSDSKTRVHAADFLGVQPQIRDIFAGDDVKTRQEIIDQIKDRVQRRHTGSGEYTGLLVCLLALFGLANSIRKADSPYSPQERWATWFWSGAALISLLAAWGQHGFVYRFIYEMPFLTNIRSPMKFMHPLNISLIILSGYGLEVLHRRYLATPPNGKSFFQVLFGGMKRFSGFDLIWAIASIVAVVGSLAALLIYTGSRGDLTNYLEHNGFGKDIAPQIANFTISEVGLYLVYLTISAGLIIAVLTGAFAGNKAVFAWAGLAAIMICDLSRADIPWIRYFNYQQKYSMNPVVDLLRKDPWEHRVVSRTSPMGGYDLGGTDPNFGGLCHWWLENDYPYNDIESLEIDQAPRMPVLDSAYIGNFAIRSGSDLTPALRLWKLTNTRYIFADARLEALLNQMAQPPNSFHTIMRMDMVIKPGVSQVEDAGDMTVKTNATGALALIEFPGALPRCKLYSNWQMADDQTTLQDLISPWFDVDKSVIVATNTPLTEKPGPMDADPGTVKITRYQSKHVVLEADAKTPAVLLLNDRTGDWWRAWVDEKPAPMLRCNYIMQGVFVPPGHHTIDFRFEPPLKFLYISVAALVVGVLLGSYVVFNHFWLEPRVESKPAA
ncbi:MAG TPA: hypothetical protein VMR33_07590 [Candidatus Baltobacteraceae bacterium]|jgi:hypothetical protein|nr:hypothetical protein [Candidatus Baltobacteraceae bacterium]